MTQAVGMPVTSTAGRDLQNGAKGESLSSLSTSENTSSMRSSCSPSPASA